MTLMMAAPACAQAQRDSKASTVVANFFPVAEAAARVGGRFVHVTNLTPAGVEPHDLELTSDDVDRIQDATAVFFVGSGFQPGIATAAKKRRKLNVDVAVGLIASGHDPHFWLDPVLMTKAVERVRAGLAKADPRHAADFHTNARAYQEELAALDADYTATLEHCTRREIVTAHAAFFYLARRYKLVQHAITGVTPDAEADPKRLAELSDLVARDGITTVFYEDLVPRDFAETLAKNAHVKTAVLSPIEGLNKRAGAAGSSYVSVMRQNLAALATALDCKVAA